MRDLHVGQPRTGVSGAPRTLIATREQEVDEYDRRERAFLGLAYTDLEVEELTMFRALNTRDNIIAQATRISRDLAFVVSVDAAAIATNGVALRRLPEVGTDADLQTVRATWRRSAMDEALPRRALEMCGLGAIAVEVALDDAGEPRIVWHDPRTVQVWKGQDGQRIERAVIAFRYTGKASIDPKTGAAGTEEQHDYVKVCTPERIDVFRDGELSVKESGPNTLGVVPVRLIEYGRFGRQTVPLCAMSAYDDGIASFDSVVSQVRTIGTRNANPAIVATGMEIPDGANLQEPGVEISTPAPDADVKWLELSMQGLTALLETAIRVTETLRATLPEFLFVDAGASASGLSLSYRATAFVSKVTPIREGFYRALEWACSVALALSRGSAWSEDLQVFEVDGGPALPMDQGAVVLMLGELLDRELITREDAVRTLQGMGVVPDSVDAVEYVGKIMLESTAAKDDAEARVRRIKGEPAQAPTGPSDAQTADDLPAAPVAPPADALADTALNGAQVSAAVDIVAQVATGALPRDAGVAMLIEFFQLDPARAERVMGSVGRGFTPAEPSTAPIPAP